MNDRTIADAFNRQFAVSHGTLLRGGALEPAYHPDAGRRSLLGRSIIRYRSNYAASALHELAHWCLADEAARQRYDYGFRYDPPPRDGHRQRAFFAAELPVQALEKVFCEAAAIPFQVSADDLAATPDLVERFATEVAAMATETLLNDDALCIVVLLREQAGQAELAEKENQKAQITSMGN